jgi:hypothetical protein
MKKKTIKKNKSLRDSFLRIQYHSKDFNKIIITTY